MGQAQQAPGKQAPMQQGPMQAPGKGNAYYGGQQYSTGYANYNCAGCGNGYQQNYYTGYNNGYGNNYGGQYYARRGLFGRRR